ncbi:TPM domain-containing protein [Mucilaginibacter sp. HC2]|uniref:TPM domain-containing protein n=1 Tax=Mucilaginibacter inviolabilis TaxID=2714892 RepID=UPI00140AEA85|nr:TPM domain-containing protein [Mucilaginibacter inviolabilis]NHA07412.1 TPM domain-containing protein [Mucilaginibacter inviolabilis]
MFKKIILFFTLVLCAFTVFAQDFPERSNTLVTDYTNTLSAEDKQRLESKLVAFNDSTSTQIAIVIIRSIGSYDVNEYGAALGRKWGIGQKGKNNGVLILVAINDRKLTIQTGFGAEGALPDIVTQEIRVNDINPRFKAGDYYGGLNAGVDQIIKYTKGEYKADKKPQAKHESGGGSVLIVIIIVIVIIILIFRNRGGGGGRQIIGSRGGASPFWWFLAGNMLGGGGRGGDWGGFSGGGNDSGGGDSGGFGGFGGGDFGGGGSGGSW